MEDYEFNINSFIAEQRSIIAEETRLESITQSDDKGNNRCDENTKPGFGLLLEDKENFEPLNQSGQCNIGDELGKSDKEAFIDKLVDAEHPLIRADDKINCAMLRYGEYSPNNPQLRVTTAPYIGLGEYEQKRNYYLQKQKADYLKHLAQKSDSLRELSKSLNKKRASSISKEPISKEVQTDLKNIHTKLVQYALHHPAHHVPEKELSPKSIGSYIMQNSNRSYNNYRGVDQRLTSAQNALLKPEMDKPKSILSNRRTGSPRERLLSDLQHSYTPSFMDGFSYQDRGDELERERLKRESYQHELRLQIEEKRRMQTMREDQERREQEIENRRLEQQLLRMEEEQLIEEQRRNRRDEQMRRHSEDLVRRKHDLQSRHLYTGRKHTESESSSLRNATNTDVASSKPAYPSSHYSPPISRRNPYSFNIPSTSVFADPSSSSNTTPNRYNRYETYNNYNHRSKEGAASLSRMDSLGTFDTIPRGSRFNHHHNAISSFNRFDSLSRIDSLNQQMEGCSLRDSSNSLAMNGQRRHSATQQDLSMFRRSPKLQRRSSSSRFEDSLPIPVLKAHSPVARELKNAIPFNSYSSGGSSSRYSSDALRKLEDKWQIPAVQKNILNHNSEGQNRNILTQLGAIRMQLQQEQLRMDENLRKRGITQSKAVDFH